MKVILAEEMGMCFGVRDALAAAEALADPSTVTVHGELVHNPEVTARLARRGFHLVPEDGRDGVPATPRVLITAHGVSNAERVRLAAAGKELIDTTCPLVRFAHETAQRLAAEGRFVVVIGRPGHVEVEGIVGDLSPSRSAVVPSPDRAARYPAERIGILCQTTTRPAEAEAIRAAIERANPQAEVRFADTICGPTRNRQIAALRLLGQVEALVVVGGPRSNNSRKLAELAASRGVPSFLVESASDLDAEALAAFAVVGLTAGTSTLDEAIEDVHRALVAIAPLAVASGS